MESLRVLVADDEPSIRLLVRTSLEGEGIAVVEAADGNEAIEQALRDPPDAAILDILMPVLNGWQVAERLRADPATAHIPIIFLTALNNSDNERRAKADGAWFVPKPFNPLQLPIVVRDAVGRARE